MTPEQFCYWMHGFVETNEAPQPTPAQWNQVKAHLGTVFNKVTPGPKQGKEHWPFGPGLIAPDDPLISTTTGKLIC